MAIDAALGRLGNKSGVCTSSTRPTNPFEGQLIYETDTNRTLVYDNAAWLVVADNQVLSIDSANGRVGVGTSSPSKKLHVKGDNEGIRIEDGGAADHYDIYRNDTTGFLEFTGSQTSFSGYDFEVNNGSNVMRITNSGNVGIGDTTPSYKLDVNGDINATGAIYQNGSQLSHGSFTDLSSYFSAGWSNYGSGFKGLSARRVVNDVLVEGLISYSGSTFSGRTAVATGIPSTFRPSYNRIVVVNATNTGSIDSWARVDLLSSGQLDVVSPVNFAPNGYIYIQIYGSLVT